MARIRLGWTDLSELSCRPVENSRCELQRRMGWVAVRTDDAAQLARGIICARSDAGDKYGVQRAGPGCHAPTVVHGGGHTCLGQRTCATADQVSNPRPGCRVWTRVVRRSRSHAPPRRAHQRHMHAARAYVCPPPLLRTRTGQNCFCWLGGSRSRPRCFLLISEAAETWPVEYNG
jgi:hypothetical protein